MIQVDLKNLLNKLNSFCLGTLQNAAGLCVSRTNYEVAIEHFLIKALEDPTGDIPLILRRFEIDGSRLLRGLNDVLEGAKTGNASKPVFSQYLMDWFQDAWMVSSVDLGESRVRSGALTLTLLDKQRVYTTGGYGELLSSIVPDVLRKEFWNILKTSGEQQLVEKEAALAATPGEKAAKPGAGFLERFCNDFTAQARAGKIDAVFGRDNEIRQIVDILARRRKNNPILVGDPGVGKTAVIEGLAVRIVAGDVPAMLLNTTLLGLDLGALEAGAGMKGEFENRLKGVLNEIKASEKSIILFIDEAHTLVGAGGSAGSSDAANLLKPALARGEIRTCAATTWSEYKKYFEKDPALARRFQLVKLDEPSVETTTLILRGLKNSYEASHRVIIRDDAIQSAAELADRYISGRFLPDKAIDLIDTGCARVKVNLTAKPPVLEDKERSIQALEREKAALERDRAHGIKIDEERLTAAQNSINTITAEAKEIQARWEKEKSQVEKVLDLRQKLHPDTPKPAEVGAKQKGETESKDGGKNTGKKAQDKAPEVKVEEKPVDKEALRKQLDQADRELAAIQGGNPLIQIEVGPDVLAQVVAGWTGIPVGKMQRDQAKTVIDLEKHLKERIKGQDNALEVIAERIRASKAGIKNPNSPLGVFLLVGPSGVGKTETGLVVADQLFGGERNVVTVNMSEFQEGHTISRLIGSPPGYVGFGEGGMLTEAVRQQPYSVVLLDEIEKAHQEVVSLFYQVFDKGTLTDGEGKEINFKNTIIILTSNLGTDVIQEMTSVENPPALDDVVNAVRPILSKHFKPALLARMAVIPYYSLRPEAMKRIVEIKIKWLQKTLMDNNKITLTATPAVVDQIAVRCTEVETGARNIEHILTVNVLPQLSRMILSNMITAGMPTKVKMDVGEAGAFILTQEA